MGERAFLFDASLASVLAEFERDDREWRCHPAAAIRSAPRGNAVCAMRRRG
jgi:hypothetical protein